MKRVFLALVLVTGCGADAGENQVEPSNNLVNLSTLTGLYEGGPDLQPNRICMIGNGDSASFGVVTVMGHTCSGSGTVERNGERLRFSMSGDQPCSFEAKLEGGAITFPNTVPASCSYYCGAGASFEEVDRPFVKIGSQQEDALKALDPVGEPLCSGLAAPSQP